MKISILAFLAISLLISGCGEKGGSLLRQQISCSSDNATSTTIDLVKQQLEDTVYKELSSNDQTAAVGRPSIRASIGQLTVNLDDIRTTKEDPDSTKKFCTAKLKITVPQQTLSDANQTRSDASQPNVAALANQFDVEQQADAFKVPFDYNVQPTDNGDKIYAESDNFGNVNGFFGEIIASAVMKNAVEQAHVQQKQQQATEQQQEAQAATTQKTADLASAKADDQLAIQTINAVWKNLAPQQRADLLEDERAWIKKKDADCNVAAASASIDPTERETARLKCEMQAVRDRTQVLQQLPSASPN